MSILGHAPRSPGPTRVRGGSLGRGVGCRCRSIVSLHLVRRLIGRRVWEMPRLWVGFLKACHVAAPHSFAVLLALPKAQLQQALDAHADLREQLTVHAATNLASVAQEALEVLGLTEDD